MTTFDSAEKCRKAANDGCVNETSSGGNDAHQRSLIASGFLLLLAYYLLRPVREALLLGSFNAEIRSYAVGGLALIILFLVQPYSHWLKTCSLDKVFSTVLTAGIVMLLAFAGLGTIGVSVHIAFFIWLGLFSLLAIAQFWTVAGRCVNSASAKRLFPAVAVSLSLGAIAGSQIAALTYSFLGPFGLMALAAPFLTVHLAIQSRILRQLPSGRSSPRMTANRRKVAKKKSSICGLSLIAKSAYLSAIALLVVLLNCIDTTGDYILASSVQAHVAAQAITDDVGQSALMGVLFANYFFYSCIVGLALQLFVVPRLLQKIDITGALHILPIVIFVGYGLISFVPIFSLIYIVKILETATNYAIHGTARHTLMVPLDPVSSSQGKTIIDTFFWRCGDLLHAAMLFIGIHWLGFGTAHFVAVNMALAAICLFLVRRVGSGYQRRMQTRPATRGKKPTLSHDAPLRYRRTDRPPRKPTPAIRRAAARVRVKNGWPGNAPLVPLKLNGGKRHLAQNVSAAGTCEESAGYSAVTGSLRGDRDHPAV